MTARQNAHDRRPTNDPVVSTTEQPALEHIQTSTRVLLDSASPPECRYCESAIEQGTQYKCVTVREQAGTVEEVSFCGDGCLADSRESGTETASD